jgi:hypothetical protein
MGKWQVAYDRGITDAEKTHLRTLEDKLIEAYGMKSLRWFGIRDDHAQKLYRVTEYSTPEHRLGQFTWDNLNLDPEVLGWKIGGGEFRCPDEQNEVDEDAERQAMLVEDGDAQETATDRRAADEGWTWDAETELWTLPNGSQADRQGNVL